MGRLFLIQLDEYYPGQDLIVCRICSTQFALLRDSPGLREVDGNPAIVLFRVANVHADKLIQRFEFCAVQDIHCNKCCYLLGYKLIEVSAYDPLVQSGFFLLNTQKVYGQRVGVLHLIGWTQIQGVGPEEQEAAYDQEEAEAADDQEEEEA